MNVPTTVNGGTGDLWVYVGDANDTLDSIHGQLNVWGGTGSYNFLGVYDWNSIVPHQYTRSNGMIERSGGGFGPVYIFFANMGYGYLYPGVSSIA
jgi:hypothetical protein